MSRTVDVAVVGGGIVGVAAAARLAELGARVALFERTEIAAAASGRNSGVVQHPADPLLVALYLETLAAYRGLAATGSGFALPPEPAGLLHATRDPAVARAFCAELTATQPELAPRFLDVGEPARLDPAIDPAVAGCLVEIGYPVGPAGATNAYAARARAAGAAIEVGAAASLRVRDGRAVGVEAGGEAIDAQTVVVAAGPWTPALVDPAGRWRPIRPLWGLVAAVALERPPRIVLEEVEVDAQIEGSDGRSADGVAFSLVTASGRSSLGSTFVPFEPDPARFVPLLRERGAAFVPEVGGAPVVGVRACARPLSVDGRPLVGRLPWLPGVVVAAGHGAWGISTGPATGRLAADLALGLETAPPPELDAARFPPP